MLKRKDQTMLAEAYSLVGGGDIGAPSMMGRPVMITMDMPGAEVDHQHMSHDNDDVDDSHGEHDPSEIKMAAADLYKLAEYAPKLQELVTSLPSLEGWVSAKITKAADYISSVYHYLEFEKNGAGDSCCDSDMFSSGSEDTDSCSYADKGCTCGGCSDCHK